MLNIEEIKTHTLICYHKAKASIPKAELRESTVYASAAISDSVPGYTASELKFGDYKKDKFAVLFIDIRNSTSRAELIGPVKTFLTMHAFIPAMLKVVEHHHGFVIDLMGDGIMVCFGGDTTSNTREEAVKHAGLCAIDMLRVVDEVVNPILDSDGIKYSVKCGVGVTYGDVIVTKIGINKYYDVKAYGDCINKASKYSKANNCVRVSKYIKNHWPSGKGGKISFSGNDENGYLVVDGR